MQFHMPGEERRAHHRYISTVHRVPITHNLHSCLRYLRHRAQTRRLWVDAISINQNDPEERAHQVQQMEHIFRTADTVHAWLGDARSLCIPKAFDIVYQLGSGTQFEDVRVEGRRPSSQDGGDIASFTESAWFDRLWVKQEAALGRNLIFHHKHSQISVFVLLACFETSQDMPDISGLMAYKDEPSYDRVGLIIEDLRVSRMLISGNASTRSLHTELVSFMSRLRASQVYDARDRIYGLSGIFSAVFDKDLVRVDYSLPAQKVFTEFAFAFITATASLALLSQVNSDENALGTLPTWVPDWSSRYSFGAERWRYRWLDRHFRASGERLTKPSIDRASGIIGLQGCLQKLVASVGDVCEIDLAADGSTETMITTSDEFHTALACLDGWESVARNVSIVSLAMYPQTIIRDSEWDETGARCIRTQDVSAATRYFSQGKEDLSDQKWTIQSHHLLLMISRSRFFVCGDGLPGLGPPDTQ